MPECDACPNPADPGYHVELEHPQDGEPALAVRTLCESCADQHRGLLELLGERVTLAAYYCPACESFWIAPVSGHLDYCGDCDTLLAEKVLTESTVFSSLERSNARVVSPDA